MTPQIWIRLELVEHIPLPCALYIYVLQWIVVLSVASWKSSMATANCLSTRFFETCLDQRAVLCTELNKGSTPARASTCTAYTARVKVINPKNASGNVIQSWCTDETYKYMYTSLDNLKSQLGKAIVAWLSKKNERIHATDCHLYSAN